MAMCGKPDQHQLGPDGMKPIWAAWIDLEVLCRVIRVCMYICIYIYIYIYITYARSSVEGSLLQTHASTDALRLHKVFPSGILEPVEKTGGPDE